jgi:hypothetical protein
MFHGLTRLLGSVLMACVILSCVSWNNPHASMSPSDLRRMVPLLECHAQDEARLLDALTATSEFERFAQVVSHGADKNAEIVWLLKEYEGGIFGALCLAGVDSSYHATWLPLHEKGQPVSVQAGAVDRSRAKVVWEILGTSPWTEAPIYRNFRVGEETSPAPIFLSVHTPSGTIFHCASYSYHQTSYSTLFHAMVECVGRTNFMGRYEMLVLPP